MKNLIILGFLLFPLLSCSPYYVRPEGVIFFTNRSTDSILNQAPVDPIGETTQFYFNKIKGLIEITGHPDDTDRISRFMQNILKSTGYGPWTSGKPVIIVNCNCRPKNLSYYGSHVFLCPDSVFEKSKMMDFSGRTHITWCKIRISKRLFSGFISGHLSAPYKASVEILMTGNSDLDCKYTVFLNSSGNVIGFTLKSGRIY
jgi:hypothetical protein